MGHNHTAGIAAKLLVPIHPNIGLDGEAREAIIKTLNTFLADEVVLATKTRSAHWHLSGPGFLDLRTLFIQQFNQLNQISDEIAERVSVLGGFAISSFDEFLSYSRLKVLPGEVPDMMGLLAAHEACVRFLREDARKCLEDYEDHGTYALFVSFIGLHEKMAWILRSYIEPEMTRDESLGNKLVGLIN